MMEQHTTTYSAHAVMPLIVGEVLVGMQFASSDRMLAGMKCGTCLNDAAVVTEKCLTEAPTSFQSSFEFQQTNVNNATK